MLENLKACPLFSSLSDPDLKKIASLARSMKFNKGVMIFSQGDRADGFYVVANGTIRIFQSSANGKEHLLHIFGAGDAFGEAAAFSTGRFPAAAEAMAKSELIFIPAKVFKETISENPAATVNIIGTLSTMIHMFVEKIESLTLKDASARFAEYLLTLAKGKKYSPLVLKLPAKKAAIAAQLNITQETLSRVISRMRAAKLINISGSQITIQNIKEIQGVAEKEL